MAIEIKTENELKEFLLKYGVKFGKTFNDFRFCISFYDNQTDSELYREVFEHPVHAIKMLNELCPKFKVSIEHVTIYLENCYKPFSDEFHNFKDNVILSPWIYYKKEDIELKRSESIKYQELMDFVSQVKQFFDNNSK